MSTGQTIEMALARYVEPSAGDDCWPWRGARCGAGYGVVRICGRQRRGHRIAYEAAHGPIPDGLLIRHSCDNPPCVNPNHLLIGTHADNNRDTRDRRRNRFGSLSPWARLTEADVIDIRRRWREGEKQTDIAREYGLNKTTVGHAIHGRTWKHVGAEAS